MRKLCLSILALSVGSTAMAADVVKLNKNSASFMNNELYISSQPQLEEIKHVNGTTRYQQLINGVPVYGHHVIHHNNKKQGYYTGHWVKATAEEKVSFKATANRVSAEDALATAKQDFQSKDKSLTTEGYTFANTASKLHYIVNAHGKLQKVYVVSFFADTAKGGKPARPVYFIDADSKAIVKQFDALTFDKIGTGPGGNEKIGQYEYGKDYPSFDVTVDTDGSTCLMDGTNVRTINLDNGYSGNKTFSYQCPYHSADDKVNGGYSSLNDAQFFGAVIFDMYKDWYNTAPLTFKLKMRVHYGDHYENAFWNGSSMTFGDGHYYFYPLVALDVVAHEVSHGVTEQNSGLEYWGQSGGINEAFSDMAGKVAEFYMRGHNTWGIGEDIVKGNRPLRYMDTPAKDGRSIGDARDYYSGLDVHYSSGVYNKLFYLLANKEGWDTRKAFDVMLKANQSYWEPSSNYHEAAEGLISAATDLGYSVEDVVSAAKGVGITCELEAGEYECMISGPNDAK